MSALRSGTRELMNIKREVKTNERKAESKEI